MEKAPIILIADDDVWQQKLIEITLSGMGFQIFSANDGEKALSLLQEHTPDVILLDIQMPKKMDSKCWPRSNRTKTPREFRWSWLRAAKKMKHGLGHSNWARTIF